MTLLLSMASIYGATPFDEANELAKQKRWRELDSLWEEQVKKEPQNEDYLQAQIRAKLWQKDWDAATALLRKKESNLSFAYQKLRLDLAIETRNKSAWVRLLKSNNELRNDFDFDAYFNWIGLGIDLQRDREWDFLAEKEVLNSDIANLKQIAVWNQGKFSWRNEISQNLFEEKLLPNQELSSSAFNGSWQSCWEQYFDNWVWQIKGRASISRDHRLARRQVDEGWVWSGAMAIRSISGELDWRAEGGWEEFSVKDFDRERIKTKRIPFGALSSHWPLGRLHFWFSGVFEALPVDYKESAINLRQSYQWETLYHLDKVIDGLMLSGVVRYRNDLEPTVGYYSFNQEIKQQLVLSHRLRLNSNFQMLDLHSEGEIYTLQNETEQTSSTSLVRRDVYWNYSWGFKWSEKWSHQFADEFKVELNGSYLWSPNVYASWQFGMILKYFLD